MRFKKRRRRHCPECGGELHLAKLGSRRVAHCWADRLRWFIVGGALVGRTPLDEVYAEMTNVCAAVLASQRSGSEVEGWPPADVWVPQFLEIVGPPPDELTTDLQSERAAE